MLTYKSYYVKFINTPTHFLVGPHTVADVVITLEHHRDLHVNTARASRRHPVGVKKPGGHAAFRR